MMLEVFGIHPEIERLYLAMLDNPQATPTELGVVVSLDERAVRAGLDQLAHMALLQPSIENPLMLRPISPDVGIEALLARQQSDLLKRQHDLEQARADLGVLMAERAFRCTPSIDVEEVTGTDAIRDRLAQLALATRNEVLALVPDGAQRPAALDVSKPLDRQMLERGAAMRSVYLDSIRNDPPTLDYVKWFTGLGGSVRTIPTLPLRLLVVDREIAVVPINPDKPGAGIALMRRAGAVAAMCALFDQIWRSASSLGEKDDPDATGLTGLERSVVELLANGHTDAIVARKLAISTRSVSRIAAALADRVGARSRFQFGVRAREQGWLD